MITLFTESVLWFKRDTQIERHSLTSVESDSPQADGKRHVPEQLQANEGFGWPNDAGRERCYDQIGDPVGHEDTDPCRHLLSSISASRMRIGQVRHTEPSQVLLWEDGVLPTSHCSPSAMTDPTVHATPNPVTTPKTVLCFTDAPLMDPRFGTVSLMMELVAEHLANPITST